MTRILKDYYKYRRRGIFDPMIRLQGKWLAEFGIKPGEMVNVEYQDDRIVITRVDPDGDETWHTTAQTNSSEVWAGLAEGAGEAARK